MAPDDGKRTFTTTDGTEWPVVITYATVKRLRVACGVKVGDFGKDPLWTPLGELVEDLEKFVDALYETVRPQAEAAKVSPEAFAAILGGDAIEQAQAAFVRAVADFSPSQRRPLLLALMAKGREIRAAEQTAMTKGIEAFDPIKLLTPSGSASNSPGSADSTPAP